VLGEFLESPSGIACLVEEGGSPVLNGPAVTGRWLAAAPARGGAQPGPVRGPWARTARSSRPALRVDARSGGHGPATLPLPRHARPWPPSMLVTRPGPDEPDRLLGPPCRNRPGCRAGPGAWST